MAGRVADTSAQPLLPYQAPVYIYVQTECEESFKVRWKIDGQSV